MGVFGYSVNIAVKTKFWEAWTGDISIFKLFGAMPTQILQAVLWENSPAKYLSEPEIIIGEESR